MTKTILKKITIPRNPLTSDEISADEKKLLNNFFLKNGLTTSTFYLRFFQKGFFAWEIMGINKCKHTFLELPEVSNVLKDYMPVGYEGKYGFLYEHAKSEEPGCFYAALREAKSGLCSKFLDYMSELGMCSGTAIRRFVEEDWKPWEVAGIEDMLNDYMKNAN